ncbi:hypothetical protein P8452_17918 [Trifolium repens]|nr:hypothetical protein P8452_17918 [Trifolium repens]
MELQLNRPICRGEVLLSTLIKKNGNYVNDKGKAIADKISENLLQDQERAATLGVPSKINAYPDDAVGKVYGAEHSGRLAYLTSFLQGKFGDELPLFNQGSST